MRGNIKEELLFNVHFPQTNKKEKKKKKKLKISKEFVCLVEKYNDFFLITL